jgi:lia operon protein LiaF
MKNKVGNQWLFSIILFLIGVGLLLANIGVISWGIKNSVYMLLPLVILVIGIIQFLKSFIKRKMSGILPGLFFLIYGALLMGARNHLVEFHYGDWWKLWPIILIYTAIKVLFIKKKITVSFGDDFPFREDWKKKIANETEGKKLWAEKEIHYKKNRKLNKKGFIIGNVKFNGPNWPLESIDLYNLIGDYYFDFGKAYIPEGETTVRIKGTIGDVKMLIPEDVPVDIQIIVKVGDIRMFKNKVESHSLHYRSPDFDTSTKKIYMEISLSIGSVRINHV